ncbi:MAG: Crp/Fnr family transcriptional regulator [Gemmatimonadota bacterium]|jgi:CRP/FNR family transcriptional regulator
MHESSLFQGLDPTAARRLRRAAVVRDYAAGTVIWREGEPSRGLALIETGRIRVVRSIGGRQFVVHTEGPGGTLGEIPTFDGGTYPATAVAASRCRCAFLPAEAVLAAVDADPAFARALLARLGRRLRGLVGRLADATTGTVRSRLAAHLLARAALAGGGPFSLDGTQAELAEELGTVREVVARELSRLRARRIIAGAGRGRFRLVDEAGLERINRP